MGNSGVSLRLSPHMAGGEKSHTCTSPSPPAVHTVDSPFGRKRMELTEPVWPVYEQWLVDAWVVHKRAVRSAQAVPNTVRSFFHDVTCTAHIVNPGKNGHKCRA